MAKKKGKAIQCFHYAARASFALIFHNLESKSLPTHTNTPPFWYFSLSYPLPVLFPTSALCLSLSYSPLLLLFLLCKRMARSYSISTALVFTFETRKTPTLRSKRRGVGLNSGVHAGGSPPSMKILSFFFTLKNHNLANVFQAQSLDVG